MKTSLFFKRSEADRHGMTLVELLVVMSVMVTLVAVSIPVFKPMLESQRSAGAARSVALTLQRTRVKAMQDKKAYGLQFIRYAENIQDPTGQDIFAYNNMSLQMRLQRESNAYASREQFRVLVDDGKLIPCVYVENGDQRFWTNKPKRLKQVVTDYNSLPDSVVDPAQTQVTSFANGWTSNVIGGYQIRFGRQGRFYTLADSYHLKQPYNQLTLPDMELEKHADSADVQNDIIVSKYALEFLVTRPPLPALAPQIVLPRGTVVDLRFSGPHFTMQDTNRPTFAGSDAVAVMFSPGGYVDGILSGSNGYEVEKTNRMIYFCIGEWERQTYNAQGENYADDGLNNLMIPSNYWVTVHPRTGQVRVTQFAAASSPDIEAWKNETDEDKKQERLERMIPGVRQFAAEHFFDLGGF